MIVSAGGVCQASATGFASSSAWPRSPTLENPDLQYASSLTDWLPARPPTPASRPTYYLAAGREGHEGGEAVPGVEPDLLAHLRHHLRAEERLEGGVQEGQRRGGVEAVRLQLHHPPHLARVGRVHEPDRPAPSRREYCFAAAAAAAAAARAALLACRRGGWAGRCCEGGLLGGGWPAPPAAAGGPAGNGWRAATAAAEDRRGVALQATAWPGLCPCPHINHPLHSASLRAFCGGAGRQGASRPRFGREWPVQSTAAAGNRSQSRWR